MRGRPGSNGSTTTVTDSDTEEEGKDDPEESFKKENKYREPPVVPIYVQQTRCLK